MKHLFTKKSALAMLSISIAFSNPAIAEEGATGHYAIGGMAPQYFLIVQIHNLEYET
jgi:hypothetical protein